MEGLLGSRLCKSLMGVLYDIVSEKGSIGLHIRVLIYERFKPGVIKVHFRAFVVQGLGWI